MNFPDRFPPIQLKTSPETAQSLSEQLLEQLRQLIQSGRVPIGSQLPTVRQFARQAGIHFNTVARVYRQLDQEGLISTQQGRGTFVRAKKDPAPKPLAVEDQQSLLRITASIQQESARLNIPVQQYLELLSQELFSKNED